MPQQPPQSSLFETTASEPLAARMRPRFLSEFIGQDRIIGPGRLLRRAIEADQLSSVIFYGPPGTGKTTLARVVANTTKARFSAINAVLAGVKDIREAVAEAQVQRRAGQRTILFVDEVHRFNKAQQDALLPWVENGTVILIGATTENPYFEVNKALVSRSRIFQLTPLTEQDLRNVTLQALADPERGYGKLATHLDENALDHLVNVANGDARALLNALELAVVTTPPGADGVITITREVAEESIQRRAVLYDKEGDAHFDTISAFIKSLRGSDPDAALYWLAKMVYAGEDPRFIMRRLLILASEDVGLADPAALGVVAAAAQAFDYVGLPEGRFHLAQATLYLATAPKSNSSLGFFDALAAVEQEREAEVPDHLRDSSRDAEGFGHGAGYLYPHAYRDHWVAQQYLPEALQGKLFYDPSDVGYEARIREQVRRRREALLAAMLEQGGEPSPAPLRRIGVDAARDRWLERTVSRAGERLARVRDQLFELAEVASHHLVLDLKAGSGLITWEALRRAPEGQVWALEADLAAAEALRQIASDLPQLQRPKVVVATPAQAREVVARELAAEAVAPQGSGAGQSPDGVVGESGNGNRRFDVILGRGVLSGLATAPAELHAFFTDKLALLAPGGRLALVETLPGQAQRLYRLVDFGDTKKLAERVKQAEEGIYAALGDWDPEGVAAAATRAGLVSSRVVTKAFTSRERIARATVEGWFTTVAGPTAAPAETARPNGTGPGAAAVGGQRGSATPSYADRLAELLDPEELAIVRETYLRQLADREVTWTVEASFIVAEAPDQPP